MKTIIRSINYILLIILFLICGFTVVAYAAGYKIDITNRNIMQTSIIDIQTNTPESEIYLDSELIGKGKAIARGLEPKSYQIEVKKDQFHTWSKKVELKKGEALTINGIILFRENPTIEEFSQKIDNESLKKLADTDNLVVANGEIFQNDLFVTRFSNDPQGICWYTDRRYIAYSQSGYLKLIEIDGTNSIELLKKDSDSPVIFVNSGKSVIYENEGKIFRAEIR